MDLALVVTADGPDIVITDGKPEITDGLFNAVYLSLFSGAWWGNAVGGKAGRFRSRIDELTASVLTAQVRLDIIEEARLALRWMVDEGIASEITVTAEIRDAHRLSLGVEISRATGVDRFTFSLAWEAQQESLV